MVYSYTSIRNSVFKLQFIDVSSKINYRYLSIGLSELIFTNEESIKLLKINLAPECIHYNVMVWGLVHAYETLYIIFIAITTSAIILSSLKQLFVRGRSLLKHCRSYSLMLIIVRVIPSGRSRLMFDSQAQMKCANK